MNKKIFPLFFLFFICYSFHDGWTGLVTYYPTPPPPVLTNLTPVPTVGPVAYLYYAPDDWTNPPAPYTPSNCAGCAWVITSAYPVVVWQNMCAVCFDFSDLLVMPVSSGKTVRMTAQEYNDADITDADGNAVPGVNPDGGDVLVYFDSNGKVTGFMQGGSYTGSISFGSFQDDVNSFPTGPPNIGVPTETSNQAIFDPSTFGGLRLTDAAGNPIALDPSLGDATVNFDAQGNVVDWIQNGEYFVPKENGPTAPEPPPVVADANTPSGAANQDDDTDTASVPPTPVVTPAAGAGSAVPGTTSTGHPVNTLTGDAWLTSTDFNYQRNGFPLKFERYFENGITSPGGELGPGWMSNYDMCVYIPAPNTPFSNATLVLPHVTWKFTTSDNGNTFTSPRGCFYQLQNVSGNYILTDSHGVTCTFQVLPCGEENVARLTEMDDLNGNKAVLTYENFFYHESIVVPRADTILYGSLFSIYMTPLQVFQNTGVRLHMVTVNNGTINFSYYDNPNPPAQDYFFNFSYTNPYGNRLQQVTNSVGDTLQFDASGQSGPVTQVNRLPSGLNASYQYYSYKADAAGTQLPITSLKSIVDPSEAPGYRNITYVCDNDPSSVHNRVRQIVNGMGQVMFSYDYTHDGTGRQVTSTSGPNGLLETDVYDSSNLWVQKLFTIDGHPHTENYTWSPDYLKTRILDGNNHETDMAYDPLGNLTYRKDGEGNAEYFSYNNISRLISSTDKNQVTRNYDYDTHGNLLHVREPGRLTSFQYVFDVSNALRQKTVTDGNQHDTNYFYDKNQSVTLLVEPSPGLPENVAGYSVTFTYDDRCNMTSKIDALSQTTQFLFTNGTFLKKITYPDNTTETFSYDLNGNVTDAVDRNTVTTHRVYDPVGRLTDVYSAYGRSEQRHVGYGYDAVVNRTSITDGNTHQMTYTYNEQNLVRSFLDANGKGYTNSYDGVLNPVTVKDTRGVSKTMTYYRNNRLHVIQFSDGTPSITYNYDGNGNRVGMTDAVGPKTYNYDSLNRMTSLIDTARNFNISYTYDSMNRLTMQNNKVNGTVNYGYYNNNVLSSVTDGEGIKTTYLFDILKNPQDTVYANGVTTAYAFDYTNHTNQLLSLQNMNSRGEVISGFSYTYDNVGNQQTMLDITGKTTYVYDALYQLKSATYPGQRGNTSYIYDGAGNRTSLILNGSSQTLNYDSGNELTSDPSVTYTYDSAGNLITKTLSASATVYSWNALDEMTKISITPGSAAITYVYDGDGHRVQKMSASGTVNYYYDGSSVLAEADGNGKVLKAYNPGISVKDGQGNKLFYLYNGHGDMAGLMDSKQGLVQSYVYDAFGQTFGTQSDSNNYRYVGKADVFSDDDAGLQYMWHRWYDPNIGRFISTDRAGVSGGLNLFAYAQNNPINKIDFLGLCPNTIAEGGDLLSQASEALGNYDQILEIGLKNLPEDLLNLGGEFKDLAKDTGTAAALAGIIGDVTNDIATHQSIELIVGDVLKGGIDSFLTGAAITATVLRTGDPALAVMDSQMTHESITNIYNKDIAPYLH